MANQTYHETYETAAKELESLLAEQERIEERILSLRKTMNALATLISQHEGKDKNFMDYAEARLRQTIDTSLTDDILRIVTASGHPLTASEIRDELKQLGGGLIEHSNPLATIHAIASRLVESGRAKETLKDGKKAWTKRLRVPFAHKIKNFDDAVKRKKKFDPDDPNLPVNKSGMRGMNK